MNAERSLRRPYRADRFWYGYLGLKRQAESFNPFGIKSLNRRFAATALSSLNANFSRNCHRGDASMNRRTTLTANFVPGKNRGRIL